MSSVNIKYGVVYIKSISQGTACCCSLFKWAKNDTNAINN